jgi:hypothetical protein
MFMKMGSETKKKKKRVSNAFTGKVVCVIIVKTNNFYLIWFEYHVERGKQQQ